MALSYEVFEGLAGQVAHIPEGSVVTRMVHCNERVRVSVLGFAPGQELVEDRPRQAAILEFWRGDGLVLLGDNDGHGDAHEVGPGSWIYVEAGTPHTIQARSEMVMLLTLLRCD